MTAAERAHRRAVETNLPDLVRVLDEALGRSLLAHIAGVDPKTIGRWIDAKQAPRADVAEARIRTAFQVMQMLLVRDSEHTVRAWFIGLNPQLDDTAPAEALRAGQLREVIVAVKSFTLAG
jgi:hypothetical protein